MVDPEVAYQSLVSGDVARIRSEAEVLESAARKLATTREDVADAAGVPVWSGGSAQAFVQRVGGLDQGLGVTRVAIVQTRGALETAATAYDTAISNAEANLALWRNRPTGLPPIIEEIYGTLINGAIVGAGTTYNNQLLAIDAVLNGNDVDLEVLDDETRKWVEEGQKKNEEWLSGSNSLLGPLIPNTAATGDDRGLIPQGLGYHPGSGTLVQGYYTKDGQSYLALIDETTGKEIGEVKLGGTHAPTHAGGVTVDGDNVYVVDNGEVYTYSMTELQNAGTGDTVPQAADPQTGMDGGSYSAIHGNKLYLGDFEKNEMYVYERQGGQWAKVDTVETPDNTQGVLVRNGEYVFSASSGRHENNSQLYVQDLDGNRSDPYDLPSMSQGVVEVDGELVVTYESGAEEFDHAIGGTSGWWWGLDDYGDLWANPHMTRTPLSALGLSPDFDVDPPTLKEAAGLVDDSASALATVTSNVREVKVPASAFGQVPHASAFATSVNTVATGAAESLRTGVRAMNLAAELLDHNRSTYVRTDDDAGAGLRSRER